MGYTLTSQSGCPYGYDACTACETTKYKCMASPTLTVNWSSPKPFKLVMLYANLNGKQVTIGRLVGDSGSIKYTEIKIGDSITFVNGYGIIEGDPNGSDIQNLESQKSIYISEGKDYSVDIRFASPQTLIVPFAYVKEVYNLSGGNTSWYRDIIEALAGMKNTRLYSSYASPEHYGITTTGADYSLKGPDSETSLTLYHHPRPASPFISPSAGQASCNLMSVTRNGSTVSKNDDYYSQIIRSSGEAEIKVIITYNCQVFY